MLVHLMLHKPQKTIKFELERLAVHNCSQVSPADDEEIPLFYTYFHLEFLKGFKCITDWSRFKKHFRLKGLNETKPTSKFQNDGQNIYKYVKQSLLHTFLGKWT